MSKAGINNPTDSVEHHLKLIEAVRGSNVARVWFALKLGGESLETAVFQAQWASPSAILRLHECWNFSRPP